MNYAKAKFTLEPDGTLVVYEQGAQAVSYSPDNKVATPVVDALGAPVYNGATLRITPAQIAAHRRDPAFDAALPADVRAALGG